MVTTNGNMAEFVFYRPQAKKVCILGDFNGWRDNELTMTRQTDGTWIARIYLPSGDFKFRYRADGEWFIDFAAFGIECGDFGLDSVVRIVPEKSKAHASTVRHHRPSRQSATDRAEAARPAGARSSSRNAVA